MSLQPPISLIPQELHRFKCSNMYFHLSSLSLAYTSFISLSNKGGERALAFKFQSLSIKLSCWESACIYCTKVLASTVALQGHIWACSFPLLEFVYPTLSGWERMLPVPILKETRRERILKINILRSSLLTRNSLSFENHPFIFFCFPQGFGRLNLEDHRRLLKMLGCNVLRHYN